MHVGFLGIVSAIENAQHSPKEEWYNDRDPTGMGDQSNPEAHHALYDPGPKSVEKIEVYSKNENQNRIDASDTIVCDG